MTELSKFLIEALSQTDFFHEARWIEEFVRHGQVPTFSTLSVTKKYSDVIVQSAFEICERRKSGEPLAYIFGSWAFREHEFYCGKGVLIPRPETEELVDLVTQMVDCDMVSANQVRVADFGAGTGCLGISVGIELLKKFPNLSVQLLLIEESAQAFEFLVRNVKKIGSQFTRLNIQTIHRHWNAISNLKIDVMLSNPPYLSQEEFLKIDRGVRDFEPSDALVPRSDPTGFKAYEELITIAQRSGVSLLAFELGTFQAKWIEDFFGSKCNGFETSLHQDTSSKMRFFTAKKLN